MCNKFLPRNYLFLHPHSKYYHVIDLFFLGAAPVFKGFFENGFLLIHWQIVDFEEKLAETTALEFLLGLAAELVLETVGECIKAVALLELNLDAMEGFQLHENTHRHLVSLENLDFVVADEDERIISTCV